MKQNLRILVVDDDEFERKSMQALLSSWGCDVRVEESIEAAYADIAEQKPDLIITDYRLRDGFIGADLTWRANKTDNGSAGYYYYRRYLTGPYSGSARGRSSTVA